jgi:glycosyltransferase involved in cell wall biosynthesis
MRIVICALDGPEPRTNGIRLAVGALFEELRKKHEIRYIGYRMPDQGDFRNNSEIQLIEPPARPIRGATLLRATLRRRPWEADRLAAGLETALARELKTFDPDIVHVTRWLLAGLGKTIPQVPSVLTAFDAWHLNIDASLAVTSGLRRPLLRAEARHTRRFEAEEFARFGRVVVVSEQDRTALEELNPDLRISVIPNGVDTTFFSDDQAAVIPNRIVFTGHMGYPPNIVAAEFLARQLLPKVRVTHPEAHLVVVGRDPHPRVRRLASLDAVEVTGEVADIRPWLGSASVYTCPMLSGTGIKNKLLEAMASGRPCVATPLALQGLDVTPGKQVLVGETAQELGAHISALLDDEVAAQKLGDAARDYVVARHSWGAVAQAYERIYYDVRSE